MSIFKKKSLLIATIVYWFLLLYMVAALVYWFIALQQQSHQMALSKRIEINASDPAYLQKNLLINEEEHRKTLQFIGEGGSFLLVILIGAVFVYRAIKRQLTLNQQQQNFMMAITHELKTPIAVAKLNLETIQKHKLEEGQQQKLIQKTLEETNRLNNLTNNILISSQLEGGGYKLSREELDLTQLAKSCAQGFHNHFPDRTLLSNIAEALEIKGDSLLLQILINNLLENAVKYSPKSSVIHLNVSKEPGAVFVQVADEGPGIADAEKKMVFNRFYRIGNEQVRKTTGTGLGLFICKRIAAEHHAKISLTNNQPTGSIFTVYFNL
jgi:two-component system, OmpR family, sensor histidine kinase CiaH